jgi:long-chain-fatty-acid--CoA ligase ACSBG
MPLLNSYGLSETTSGMTLQNYDKFSLAAAGYAMDGTELKIFNPDENGIGEICMRGRNIMNGYLKNEEATTEVIDNQGYFHSGDTGRVDSDGFLYITGRIKELIITAGGENIAPVILEDNLKTFTNVISNIMVVGEG